jgi:hypothetical protein
VCGHGSWWRAAPLQFVFVLFILRRGCTLAAAARLCRASHSTRSAFTCVIVYRGCRSAARLNLNLLKEAMEDAEACIGLAPTYVKGYIRKAAVLRAQNRFADEVSALAAAQALEPDHPEVLSVLMLARQRAMLCAECSKPAISQCGSCSNERYCSRECQTKRWAIHKRECMGEAGAARAAASSSTAAAAAAAATAASATAAAAKAARSEPKKVCGEKITLSRSAQVWAGSRV